MSGNEPFPGLSKFQLLGQLMAGELPADLSTVTVMNETEDTVKKVVMRCWSRLPEQRPQCGDIVKRLRADSRYGKQDEVNKIQEVQELRNAMKGEEISLDLDKINQIFHRVRISSILVVSLVDALNAD